MIKTIREFLSPQQPVAPVIGEHLPTHLLRLLTQLEINCVIDVGASRGQFGQLLREAGFNGYICSFEPSPADYPVLAQNAHPDPRWTTHQKALGEENGQLEMNIFNDTVFNSFKEPSDYILSHGCKVERVEQVEVVRLDDLYDELIAPLSNPRVYLKLDTQGYDQTVLRGATETVQRVLALQTEVPVHPIYKDVPSYLEAIAHLNVLGFDLTGLFPVARDEHLRVVEFDCVMVRNSAVGAFGALRQP
jgi:FkbM family methyltransferase